MFCEQTILNAYHRAIGRNLERTGVSYPIVRLNCVLPRGQIVSTDVYAPQLLARWKYDKAGRVRVRLV